MAAQRPLNACRLCPRHTTLSTRALRLTTPVCAANPIHFPRSGGSRRGYATAPGRRSARPGSGGVWGPVDVSNLTVELFETEQRKQPWMLRYHPRDYVWIANTFKTIAPKSGARWPFLYKEESRPTKEMLLDLGCISYDRKWDPDGIVKGHFTLAMWAGAFELGCELSCLNIAWHATQPGTGLANMPMLKSAMDGFRAIVNESKNPNALSIEGASLLGQKKANAAIRVLQRALEIGSEDFFWRSRCLHSLAMAYEAAGNNDKAIEIHWEASLGGMTESLVRISKITKDADEGLRAHYQASCLGVDPDHFKALSSSHMNRANDPLISSKERDKNHLWASEWLRLADSKETY